MLRPLVLVLGTFAVALLIWGFFVEPGSLRNEDYELTVPNRPVGCDGLRVAVLADLHVGSPLNGLDKLNSAIALTQRARPDPILLAGDYVIHGVAGGQFTQPEEIAQALRQLSAPLGVWAVLGNHDWWFDGPRGRDALESVGIRFLEDTAATVSSSAGAFWLVGDGNHRHAALLLAGHVDFWVIVWYSDETQYRQHESLQFRLPD